MPDDFKLSDDVSAAARGIIGREEQKAQAAMAEGLAAVLNEAARDPAFAAAASELDAEFKAMLPPELSRELSDIEAQMKSFQERGENLPENLTGRYMQIMQNPEVMETMDMLLTMGGEAASTEQLLGDALDPKPAPKPAAKSKKSAPKVV